MIPGTDTSLLISRAGDEAIAVGRTDGDGGIALVATDGTPLWTQSHVNTAYVETLASDDAGQISLLSIEDEPSIEHYDEHGAFAWHQRFEPLEFPSMAVSGAGFVILSGMPPSESPFVPRVLVVHELAPAGPTVFRTEIAISMQAYRRPGPVAVGARGDILIPGNTRVTGIGGGPRAVIHALRSDAKVCRYLEIDPEATKSIDLLATSPSGDHVFFASAQCNGSATCGLGFGKLAL